ncbi:DUF3618 domain-containing protein [Monashia sp. NPDC004114]
MTTSHPDPRFTEAGATTPESTGVSSVGRGYPEPFPESENIDPGRPGYYRDDDPDAIRLDIERTRSELSRDVNALGEAVTPGHIARRGADRVRDRAVGLKERIMGSASDVAGSATDHASDIASDVASGVGDKAQEAAYAVRRQATGSPLAAGLVALAAGWVVGALVPATQKEREIAETVKDNATPVIDEARSTAKQVAQESADHLKEPAREAAESVKQQAQSAAENVKEEGKQAAQDVRDSAAQSTDNVRRDTQ